MPADAANDLTKKYRRQDAVYWPRTGTGPTGDPTYGDPEEIKVRWDDVREQMLDGSGEMSVSNASVMIGFDIPDLRYMPVLRKGTIADLDPDAETPLDQPGAYEVRKFESIPDAKARRIFRRVLL